MIKLFEKFNNIQEVKNEILSRAIDTYDIKIIDMFLKKGYDINGDGILFLASFNQEIFKYIIKKGANLETAIKDYDFKNRLKELEVQKALIDLDKEQIIYDTVGFHWNLKHDPKYADTVQRYEDVTKYNL
jgi:hypothetical protein